MPTYSQTLHYCERQNQIERKVTETETASLHNYWESACENNFAITFGSTPLLREQALIAALRTLRIRRRGLIVVLSNSSSLERQIQAGIGRNGLGRIWCPTPESGYDLFFGMQPTKILEIMRIIGQNNMPFTVGPMTAFANAFLAIVSHAGPPRLSDMIRWAERSDEELEWAAQQQGLSEHYRENIRVNTSGGLDMRMILSWFREAFSNVSAPNCETNANISTLANEDALIFLRDRSSLPDIFRLTIMKELEVAISSGGQLTVVFDGVEPTQHNFVRELIKFAIEHANVRLGLCGTNLWAMMQPNQEQLLGAIRSWIVFSTDNQQADDFLARFGSYQYHFPVLASGNDRLLSTNYTEAIEVRQRIRRQDLSLYTALLSGHAGDYLELCGRLE